MGTISGVTTTRTVVFEETMVARYAAVAGTEFGFTLPDPTLTPPNLRAMPVESPGVIESASVILFRTRHTGRPNFFISINSSARLTQYTFTDDDPPERSWHEIIPARFPGDPKDPDEPVLHADRPNQVLFAIFGDGTVTFGDVVILYTSNESTIKIPIVLNPKG